MASISADLRLFAWSDPDLLPLDLICFAFIRASLGAQMVRNLPEYRRPGFDPWVGKFLWRREWQTTPVFLPGAWRATVHGVTKSQTGLSD